MDGQGQRVMVVDNDRTVLELLQIRLEVAGYRAYIVRGGRQALDLLLRSAATASGPDGDTVYGRGRIDVYKAYQLGLAESIRAAPTPQPIPDLPPG